MGLRPVRNALSMAAAVVLTVLVAGSPAVATTMLHHPLSDLVAEAERIVVATCVDVRDGDLARPGGGSIPYTEYTFAVNEVLKGEVGGRLTIRQFGTRTPRPTPGGRHALVTAVPAMPVYQRGDDLLLFLVEDSTLGLTSPVGLGQGAFRIVSADGARAAVNGFNNAGLFRSMPPAATAASAGLSAEETALLGATRGPARLEALLSLVRRLVR